MILRLAALAGAVLVVLLALGQSAATGAATIVFFALLAMGVRSTRASGFAFTIWVGAFVSAAMFFPAAFRSWFGYDLGGLIVPLIQIIMFGMGTQLTLGDFRRVLAFPKPVLIGMGLQFSLMPLLGRAVASIFTSNPEVAAGMVLVGASPGGVASNVMTYLAKGNVALSVTMTACSTLVAPFATPAMTSLLAGAYVDVQFFAMMTTILRMIILPVAAGLVVNWALVKAGRTFPAVSHVPAAIMTALPFVSMFAICLIIAIITSLSRDALLAGSFVAAIIAAAAIHNAGGFLLGYWGARAAGLNESDARTVSIEVGLQNAGMASGLAISVLKSPMAALPPAVFGPWMNMSGAVLASWWANHPPEPLEAGSAAPLEQPVTEIQAGRP
jgi:bile acid:Na+ symporter, BASS family